MEKTIYHFFFPFYIIVYHFLHHFYIYIYIFYIILYLNAENHDKPMDFYGIPSRFQTLPDVSIFWVQGLAIAIGMVRHGTTDVFSGLGS